MTTENNETPNNNKPPYIVFRVYVFRHHCQGLIFEYPGEPLPWLFRYDLEGIEGQVKCAYSTFAEALEEGQRFAQGHVRFWLEQICNEVRESRGLPSLWL